MLRFCHILFLISIATLIYSQPQNSVWTFGQEELFQLDFNKSPLEVIRVSNNTNFVSGSEITTSAIAASIADQNGSLMYYTNGISIYDQNYDPLPSGNQVFADIDLTSSQKGAVFITHPGNINWTMLIYLTELHDQRERPFSQITSASELAYLIIDNRLNNGLGDVIPDRAETIIGSLYAEGFTIMPGRCGAFWIIARKRRSQEIHAFRVDQEGVNTDPVVSKVIQTDRYIQTETQWPRITDVGKIAASGANRIVMTSVSGVIERYDFDPESGRFNNPQIIEHLPLNEVSQSDEYTSMIVTRDGARLFIKETQATSNNLRDVDLYQYDLTLSDGEAIRESKRFIGTYSSAGTLDDLVQHPFRPNDIIISKSQVSDLDILRCDPDEDTCWIIDNFIDLPFIASEALILNHNTTFIPDLTPPEEIFDQTDSIICNSAEFTLRPNIRMFDNILWDDGSTELTRTVNQQGEYSLTAYYNGCPFIDTMTISFDNSLSSFSLGSDRSFCDGDTVQIGSNITDVTHQWNTGAQTPDISVSESGIFSLTINNENCSLADTIELLMINSNDSFLPPDTTICIGEIISVDLTNFESAVWSDRNTDLTRTIDESTDLTVEVITQEGCVLLDSIEIDINSVEIVLLSEELITICPDESIDIIVQSPVDDIIWNNGSTELLIEVSDSGKYSLDAIVDGCPVSDSVEVALLTTTNDLIDEQAIEICPDETVELFIDIMTETILWSNSSEEASLLVSDPGQYSVVALVNGCPIRDTVSILLSNNCQVDTGTPSSSECQTYIPNVISVNSSNGNDEFRPISNCTLTDYSLQIFDRWGGRIFSTIDPSIAWDGVNTILNYQSGVYNYSIRYRYTDEDQLISESGTITLIR